MTNLFDDVDALPEPQRTAVLELIEAMRQAAFLQGYLAARLWLAAWIWRYCRL